MGLPSRRGDGATGGRPMNAEPNVVIGYRGEGTATLGAAGGAPDRVLVLVASGRADAPDDVARGGPLVAVGRPGRLPLRSRFPPSSRRPWALTWSRRASTCRWSSATGFMSFLNAAAPTPSALAGGFAAARRTTRLAQTQPAACEPVESSTPSLIPSGPRP
jgi:hypothetical protein